MTGFTPQAGNLSGSELPPIGRVLLAILHLKQYEVEAG